MRIMLFSVLMLAGCSCGPQASIDKADENAERRHNEMMAEMEAARYARLEAEKKELMRQMSENNERSFDLQFGR